LKIFIFSEILKIGILKSEFSIGGHAFESNYSYLGDFVRWSFFSKLLIELMSSSSSIFVLYSSDGGQYQLKYLAPSTSAAPLQLIIATKKYAHPVSDYISHIWTYTCCLPLTPKPLEFENIYLSIKNGSTVSQTSNKVKDGLSQ